MSSIMFLSKLRLELSRTAVINYMCRPIHSMAVEAIPQQTEIKKVKEHMPQKMTSMLDIEITTVTPSRSVLPAHPSSILSLEPRSSMVLPFDDVPGPKSLKYLAVARYYMSSIGTQVTAGALTFGYNIESIMNYRKTLKNFSSLFDTYGPVVRFVNPIGNDIVLLNNPEHIQKVFNSEGEFPVRSTLDSLEMYRTQYRNSHYTGLLSLNGEVWRRQREATYVPLNQCLAQHAPLLDEITDKLIEKVYRMRNYQDEVTSDLYKEIHKWAFECIGQVLFAKRFDILETETFTSQCDPSWFYYSLDKATEALMKCESGMHMWRLMPTPAWKMLVKYCDSLENLIGKQVMEAEQKLILDSKDDNTPQSLMVSLLCGKEKPKAEVVTTILMDMMLLGVNTVSTTASFLLYHLAKYQRAQKVLYSEIYQANNEERTVKNIPYLDACIKETLRLVPPIPLITRILPKNIILDRYNIPSGTLVIMSTQDASLKENNFDDASKFYPERWLKPEMSDYHEFASIPFGFGARKCLGKEVAETMLRVLIEKILTKYKLEYHYGDILPTKTFILKPNRQLKLRLIDRL